MSSTISQAHEVLTTATQQASPLMPDYGVLLVMS